MTDKPSETWTDEEAPLAELPDEQKAQRIVWTAEELEAIRQFVECFADQGTGYDG